MKRGKKNADISNEQTNQNDNPDPNSKPNNQQSVFRRWPLSVPLQVEKCYNPHSLVIVIRRVTDLSCEKTDAMDCPNDEKIRTYCLTFAERRGGVIVKMETRSHGKWIWATDIQRS